MSLVSRPVCLRVLDKRGYLMITGYNFGKFIYIKTCCDPHLIPLCKMIQMRVTS